MKILLIQFPWAEIHKGYEDLAKIQGFEPPLGICYLGAVALKQKHEVKIIDFEAEQMLKLSQQIKAVLDYQPDIIGITSTTPCFHKVAPFAKAIKKLIDVKIVVGGPHISVLYEKAFSKEFDFGVYGEGEITFGEFLNQVQQKKPNYSKVDGLMFWKGKKLIKNKPRAYNEDLDSLDFPARHLLKNELYNLTVPGKGIVKITNIMAMRGCPFQCVFCSAQTMWGRAARFRSAANVVNEMEQTMNELGLRHFVFTDSTLTLKRQLIVDICNEIIRRRLRVTWEGWTRANMIDEKLIRLMKKAGFIRISFGIESGDPKILKLIKKEVALSDIRKAYKLVKKYKLEATCSVMIGHPGDTKESVMKTIKFVRSIPEIKYSGLSIAVPYPGTELYDMAKNKQHGLRLLSEDFRKYVRYDNVVMCVNDLSPRDLKRYQKLGIMYIQLTPGRVWYHLTRTNIKDAFLNAKAFFKAMI